MEEDDEEEEELEMEAEVLVETEETEKTEKGYSSSSDEEWNDEFEEVSYKVITETKYDQNQW